MSFRYRSLVNIYTDYVDDESKGYLFKEALSNTAIPYGQTVIISDLDPKQLGRRRCVSVNYPISDFSFLKEFEGELNNNRSITQISDSTCRESTFYKIKNTISAFPEIAKNVIIIFKSNDQANYLYSSPEISYCRKFDFTRKKNKYNESYIEFDLTNEYWKLPLLSFFLGIARYGIEEYRTRSIYIPFVEYLINHDLFKQDLYLHSDNVNGIETYMGNDAVILNYKKEWKEFLSTLDSYYGYARVIRTLG